MLFLSSRELRDSYGRTAGATIDERSSNQEPKKRAILGLAGVEVDERGEMVIESMAQEVEGNE